MLSLIAAYITLLLNILIDAVPSLALLMHSPGEYGSGSTFRLAQLASGVLLFHVMNSILQEAVFHLPDFNHAVLMSLMQTFCMAALAFAQFHHSKEQRKAPLLTYFGLSILSSASVILTNEASRLLNYPTQVVFKSSKLIFVMALRWCVMSWQAADKEHSSGCAGGGGRKRLISMGEIGAAVLIVSGLVAFTYATSIAKFSVSSAVPHTTQEILHGVGAIVLALCCDALLYVAEERFVFRAFKASSTEVILYCYSFNVVNTLTTLVITGQAFGSVGYAVAHPSFALIVIAFSLCNFGGTHFILHIVSEIDSNSAVVVTSLRKMFTVLASFVLYPKPFTELHFLGLVLVSAGIYSHERARVVARSSSCAVPQPKEAL